MKLIISGYHGFGNMGDEAILSVLVGELKERFPQAQLVVLSARPAETAEQYGVRSLNRWNLWQILRELRSASAFLSGGGGLIQDRTSRRSALYYLSLIALARRRCPVFIVGQGIGPLRNHWLRGWATTLLSQVDCAMVRDGRSWKALRDWGLSEERLILGGDPALLLWPQGEAWREAYSTRGCAHSYVVICPKARLCERLKAVMAEQLDRLSKRHRVAITFIALHPGEDLPPAQEIAARMRQPARVIDSSKIGLKKVMEILGRAQVVMGMRLHALLFSLLTARPFVACSEGDPKIEEFLSQLESVGGPKIPCWSSYQLAEQEIDLVEAVSQQLTCGDDAQRARLVHAGEVLYRKTRQGLDSVWECLSRRIAVRGDAS